MKAIHQGLFLIFLALALALPADVRGASPTYYAVEINGVVCGYSETGEKTVQEGGREWLQADTRVVVMLTLLGSEMNSRIQVTALLDPVTRRARRSRTVIDQNGKKLEFALVLEGGDAILSSPRRREAKRIAVAPDVLVGGDELLLRLQGDFVGRGASEASYDILEQMEEEVQRSTFRRIGAERIELAGRAFQATVVEQFNTKTGAKITYWLAPGFAGALKYTLRDRSVYLADRRVVDRVKVADMDASIITPTNVAIADFTAIAYMKLKVRIAPTGMVLAVADLNVPGQKFSGTVTNNVIDGVLEIEHRRYDGGGAPPFPPSFAGDPLLKPYLEPAPEIESDDPLLAEKAREITRGAGDSWQAAKRLSQWVAENIAYAVVTNNSARRSYDRRAGECGAHSMLLAAFCRAVGIPARMVFGAMYVANRGGGFGQHAWNEIFMGQAGWVPVDATAYEIDYVDSGHIRVSEVQSVTATSFNGREITVLEHRLAGASASQAAAPSLPLASLLGRYAHPQGSRTVTVLEKEGNLALDIPGKMVLPFQAPDERGRWLCKFSPYLYLVFPKAGGAEGGVMELHQVILLPRKEAPAEAPPPLPAELAPYVGSYMLAESGAEFSVAAQDGRLAVYDPMRKETVKLLPPAADGGWREEASGNVVYFERNGEGRVVAMKVDAVDNFRRGEHAAEIVERAILARGLDAGLREYAELRGAGRADLFFSEAAFNDLGYRFLQDGKLSEAIAVFKLNVASFPESANAHDSLGEAYMKNGQNGLAADSYRKSLELNPANENAARMLEKLGGR